MSQSNPLPGRFVNDHKARIVTAALSRCDGSGGNAKNQRECDADEKSDEQALRRWVQAPCKRGPQQDCGD
jgi:hypothetical protein